MPMVVAQWFGKNYSSLETERERERDCVRKSDQGNEPLLSSSGKSKLMNLTNWFVVRVDL